MGAVWEFKSFRPKNPQDRFPIYGRFSIRRSSGPFTGSERDALAFARRACEHLSTKGTVRVEAWSKGESAEPVADSITFRLSPVGDSWRAEVNRLHHGGVWQDLDSAIDYALWRGAGKLCRVELLNQAGAVQWLVLSDQSDNDVFAGTGPTWKQRD